MNISIEWEKDRLDIYRANADKYRLYIYYRGHSWWEGVAFDDMGRERLHVFRKSLAVTQTEIETLVRQQIGIDIQAAAKAARSDPGDDDPAFPGAHSTRFIRVR